MENKYFEKI